MQPFDYLLPDTVDAAVRLKAAHPSAAFIGGGTNLLDLMKENVLRPSALIDINRLTMSSIANTPGGGLTIGALATNSAVASHPIVRRRYPLLAEAILAGASPQLRNMATTAGNLMQRTRCWYFYDLATRCNKRQPGSGCDALDGVNRIHAILGASEHCIAVHPSDMAVALAALDARVHLRGPHGERTLAIDDFYRLPGDEPHRDTNLQPHELITAVELPREGFATNFFYLKVRERNSYAFALVSVAAALKIETGVIAAAHVALGGVAHKPWRRPDLESMLIGAPDPSRFAAFARALTQGARSYGHNEFKVPLAPRAVVAALERATSRQAAPAAA